VKNSLSSKITVSTSAIYPVIYAGLFFAFELL